MPVTMPQADATVLALPDPRRLALADVNRADDHLFLHYQSRR